MVGNIRKYSETFGAESATNTVLESDPLTHPQTGFIVLGMNQIYCSGNCPISFASESLNQTNQTPIQILGVKAQ